MNLEKIYHKDLAISRLVTQFKESTNLISYIESLLVEANNLESVFFDLLEKRWLDTAEGQQLDILGSIVGQSREFIDVEIFDYFGFFNNYQAQPFGSIYNSQFGGRLISKDESSTEVKELDDEEYLKFIRAKIIRNSTNSTAEEIISQIGYILDYPLIVFTDGNTRYEISIGRRLRPNEKSILLDMDIIPKVCGVQATYVSEFEESNFFSFEGIPNSLGFGSINNITIGGKFANLI